jgi:hypothetical protein
MLMVNDECGLIRDRAGYGNCLWWLSRSGCLVVLVPFVSIKDRTDVGMCVVETLQLATYSGKPDTSSILLWERQPRTRSGEMTRVACTHALRI